jgi:5'(3')-deoxyribonucleotidase
MIITIDFDETLFPTLEKVIEIYNQRNNTTVSLDQINTYSLYESLDCSVADKILELFCDREVYDSLQPYQGAIAVTKTLIDKGHEIYIATATDVKNLIWKENLLQKYFPFIPKNNLIRIHQKKLLQTDVLIEDNLTNLINSFSERICFNQLWNQSTTKDYAYDITRVYSWNDVIDVIKEIERKNQLWEKE